MKAWKSRLLFLMLFFTCPTIKAQINEGSKPYIPTRLEWFALEMNSTYRVELSESTNYSIQFIPLEKSNTILICVFYMPSADRELMNTHIENIKEMVKLNAKSRGWNSWLKINENIKMGKSKQQ